MIPMPQLPEIAEGTTYSKMDDAVNAARIHAKTQGFSYKISHRNKARAVLKCSGSNCTAYARLSFSKKLELPALRCREACPSAFMSRIASDISWNSTRSRISCQSFTKWNDRKQVQQGKGRSNILQAAFWN